jgi:protein TonB
MKVAEAAAKQAALEKPVPEYPAMARQLRVTGRVEVEAIVDVDGKVEKAQIVNGNPMLGNAAVQALRRWKFAPFTADGKATRAVTTITFDFKL